MKIQFFENLNFAPVGAYKKNTKYILTYGVQRFMSIEASIKFVNYRV